jgi:hypothetical protein
MTTPTHVIKTVEAVNLAELAKEQNSQLSEQQKAEREYLDWSLCLLIANTNFSFEELLKQKDQAERNDCTEAEYKIEELLKTKYTFSYEHHRIECKSDHSGASDQDNR